jgi:hypothetical protein
MLIGIWAGAGSLGIGIVGSVVAMYISYRSKEDTTFIHILVWIVAIIGLLASLFIGITLETA